MKAIEEYKVSGDANGKVTLYPRNNVNVDYKKLVTDELESYLEQQKKEYTIWEKYDEFIKCSIRDYNLNINLSELDMNKDKFEEMKLNINFYTSDDFNVIIDEINREYKEIISMIENYTELKFGKDYILL